MREKDDVYTVSFLKSKFFGNIHDIYKQLSDETISANDSLQIVTEGIRPQSFRIVYNLMKS